mmetsp:Transcript_16719/g.36171  ORF Transcript_16719/g.36171 Transcript_16719/m.36171 type:complete len:245 (+) Transcript_16719:327-1061(+)
MLGVATSVTNWARGASQHDRLRVSNSNIADFLHPDVNIVHIRRPQLRLPEDRLRKHIADHPSYHSKLKINVADPEEAVATRLLDTQTFEDSTLRRLLLNDICEVVNQCGRHLGYDELSVKLEVVRRTSCPKWHADSVGMRCLCTYVGQGTWFVENRHVQRSWSWQQGDLVAAVEDVDDSSAQQSGPGDLLLLKGHKWEDNYGMGAVHKSPDILPGDLDCARLLLTVDDTPSSPHGSNCGCAGHS